MLRSSALVGRPARFGLLIGLGCLCADLLLRTGSHPKSGAGSTPEGNIGVGLVLGFLVLSLVAYQRTLYRVRRHSPEAWRPGARFLVGLLGAPLGIGDPDPKLLDRWVLRLTTLLAVALLPLSLLAR